MLLLAQIMGNPPRTSNKTYYNIKSVEVNNKKEPLAEKYFKTKKECSEYYNCCQRTIGNKLKNENKKNTGKLKNILLYKCKELIQYETIEKDISKKFIIIDDEPFKEQPIDLY